MVSCSRNKILPVSGVLFDMDGVILDTEKLYTRFWQEAAISLGYPMTLEQSLGLRSLNRNFGKAKMESYFGPGVDYDAIRNRRIEIMDAFIHANGVEAKPGIHALLDALDEMGIPRAITTSSPIERVDEYLRPLKLLERFDYIVTGYDVAKGKPAPDIYLLGAKTLGLPPKCCLALEDSPAGITSAFTAGCMPVLIPDQDRPDEATLQKVYALCDSLTDVIALLGK